MPGQYFSQSVSMFIRHVARLGLGLGSSNYKPASFGSPAGRLDSPSIRTVEIELYSYTRTLFH